ncbi:MAG: LysR family transcriptional regulator [Pseudomonadota bacterium]
MNIESLRAFLEIASSGSVLSAAERLHITQSAVSARLKQLETRVGRTLFYRKRAGMELTPAGSQFLRHAQSCVQSWERGQQEIALPAGVDHQIGLGIQMNFWDRIVLPWQDWMRNHASHLATRVVADYSEELLSRMRDGLLDLVLVYNVRQSGKSVATKILDEDLILVSTTRQSVDDDWMSNYVFVDRSEEFETMHRTAFPELPAPPLSVGSAAVGLSFILGQGGSAYFTRDEVDEHLDAGQLHVVDNAPVFNRSSYVVYQRDSAIESDIQIALDGIRHSLSQHKVTH